MLTDFKYHGNVVKIPLRILNALQAADFSDDQIYLMTPKERFYAYWDSQWVNIVNHADCYRDMDKDEAVAKAVRLTEEAMRWNMQKGFPPVAEGGPTQAAPAPEPTMSDEISRVVAEMRERTRGRSFANLTADQHAIVDWADRIEAAAKPEGEVRAECAEFVNMVGDEFGNEAGVRLRNLFATLARKLAEASDYAANAAAQKLRAELAQRKAERQLAEANRRLAEYIAARDEFEAATRPLTSHGPYRSLKHGDPLLLRYRDARAALQQKDPR